MGGAFSNAASYPQTLAQCGVPLILMGAATGSTVSVTAAGLVGSTTALATLVGGSGQACWVYVPAGFLGTGVPAAAAMYYGIIQAGLTSIQLYNNTLPAGTLWNSASIPASPTPFSGLSGGSGAIQAAGTSYQVAQFTVPAGSMGANGRLMFSGIMGCTSSSAVKGVYAAFGSSGQFALESTTTAAVTAAGIYREIVNAGFASVQNTFGGAPFPGGVSATLAQNTANAQNVTLFLEAVTNQTDYVALQSFSCIVYPG